MKKDEPLSSFDFDDDKKPQLTMYAIQKMLKELKASLAKHGKVKVIIEKAE